MRAQGKVTKKTFIVRTTINVLPTKEENVFRKQSLLEHFHFSYPIESNAVVYINNCLFVFVERQKMDKYNKCAVFGCDDPTSSRHLFPNPNKYPEQFAVWLNAVGNRLFHNDVPKLHLFAPQIQLSFVDQPLLNIEESQPGPSNKTITTSTSDVWTHNLSYEEDNLISQKRKSENWQGACQIWK
ncbi:hypothetical protein Trydic_g14027 [Trypoxylus dichotomus]